MIGSRANYYKFIIEGLGKDLKDPFKEIRNGGILGGDKFLKKIKKEQLDYGSSREQPGYKELISDYLKPEKVTEIVANTLKVDKEILVERYGNGVTRGILSEILYRYSGLKEPEIGKLLGNIDYSAVNRLRSRLKKKMEKEYQIKSKFERIEKQIKENLSSVEI
jgi:hypothetical protein